MLRIRRGESSDAGLIVRFIRGLAEYERELDAVVATEEDILRDGFGEKPRFHVLIAEWDGVATGFAFYMFLYSTWKGKPILYLEDLFVDPEFRGKGIGKALLAELARIAQKENCYSMAWEVLDWNQPAIDFYEALGANVVREWLNVRVTGEPLQRLADYT